MKISELNKRFKSFAANINTNVAIAVEGVEQELTDMNRSNLLSSLDKFDKPLKHNKTGSTKLSSGYAQRTGKTTPNIFLKGDYQADMFLTVNETNNTYDIQSNDFKHPFLTENYDNLMGVPKKRQNEAKAITTKAIGKLLKSKIR